jgi:hypothetical protein
MCKHTKGYYPDDNLLKAKLKSGSLFTSKKKRKLVYLKKKEERKLVHVAKCRCIWRAGEGDQINIWEDW